MKRVLGSSLGFKWLVPELHSDKALRLREDYRNGILELITPDLFLVELDKRFATCSIVICFLITVSRCIAVSRRFGRRRLLDVLGLTRRQQEVVATIVSGCFIGFILLFVICGGLMKLIVGEQATTRTAANAPGTSPAPPFLPRPTGNSRPKPSSRYKLTGTIRKLDSNIRFSGSVTFNITIEHNGIPGVLSPGQQLFYASAIPGGSTGDVKITNLNMDKAIGQKVDFVIESK